MVIDVSLYRINKATEKVNNGYNYLTTKCDEIYEKINEENNLFAQAFDKANEKIESGKSELYKIDNSIEKGRAILADLQDEYNSLRPPVEVTITTTDEEGNTTTETHIEDPDGPRRAALESEMEKVESKLKEMIVASDQWEEYISNLEGVAKSYRGKLEEIKQRENELATSYTSNMSVFTTIFSALKESYTVLYNYNSIVVNSYRANSVPLLRNFRYNQDHSFVSSSSQYRSNSSKEKKKPIVVIFNQTVNNNNEVISFLETDPRLKNEYVIVKVPFSLYNFKYESDIKQLATIFIGFGYKIKLDRFSNYHVDINNYFSFVKGE